MSSVIESIEQAQLRRVPEFIPGDRVKVHFQVIEGSRRRIQVFEGVVIKRQGHGVRETFTVRKQSFGVGVERMFPLHSPKIDKIEVAARGDVRRAKLYYLRDRVGKRARVRERRYIGPEQAVEPGLLNEPAPPSGGDAADGASVGADAANATAEDALNADPGAGSGDGGKPGAEAADEAASGAAKPDDGQPVAAGGSDAAGEQEPADDLAETASDGAEPVAGDGGT